jgi:hypothetical protein
MEDFTLPSIGARFKKPERKLSKGSPQTSLFLLPFWADVVNSCWLALARPAYTSSKIFKHPQLLLRRSKNYEICTPVKLMPRRMYTKCFKKYKNKMRSSDIAQNQFVCHTDIQAFRG